MMRLYQTATEKNIGDKIFPYFDSHSLTMSEEERTERISTLTENLTGSTIPSHLFIGVDFAKWCLRMSHEANTKFHQELDIFGFKNVYSYSQMFPVEAALIIQDRFYPPRADSKGLPEDGSRASRQGVRWMEGMRQKGWTLFTLIMVENVADSMETSVRIRARGDNVVLCLPTPDEKRLKQLGLSLKRYAREFVNRLAGVSDDLGVELKGEETWVSTLLFEYSKQCHLKGVPVSTGLKRASKIANESNTGLPTLANGVSSVFSGGVGVSSADQDPAAAYVLSVVEAAIIFRSGFGNLTIADACALCLVGELWEVSLQPPIVDSACVEIWIP